MLTIDILFCIKPFYRRKENSVNATWQATLYCLTYHRLMNKAPLKQCSQRSAEIRCFFIKKHIFHPFTPSSYFFLFRLHSQHKSIFIIRIWISISLQSIIKWPDMTVMRIKEGSNNKYLWSCVRFSQKSAPRGGNKTVKKRHIMSMSMIIAHWCSLFWLFHNIFISTLLVIRCFFFLFFSPASRYLFYLSFLFCTVVIPNCSHYGDFVIAHIESSSASTSSTHVLSSQTYY